jgi:membrane associated rhomboid family serine protease
MATPRPYQFDFSGIFRRPPPVTLALMIITGVASVLVMASSGAFGAGTFARLLVFSPTFVLDEWKVWTPFTYLFISPTPFSLLFHELFVLWMFTGQLERMWGPRRLLYYFFGTGTGAAFVTTLLALAVPALRVAAFDATWVVGEAIILGWVLMNWHATVYLFFFPVRAPLLILFGIAIPLLYAIQGAWTPLVPCYSAMAIGYVMLNKRGATLRRAYLHFRAWWIDRQLKRRSRHLRVVPPPDRDAERRNKYLH